MTDEKTRCILPNCSCEAKWCSDCASSYADGRIKEELATQKAEKQELFEEWARQKIEFTEKINQLEAVMDFTRKEIVRQHEEQIKKLKEQVIYFRNLKDEAFAYTKAEKKQMVKDTTEIINNHIAWLERWTVADTSKEFRQMIETFKEELRKLKARHLAYTN